MSYRKYDKRRMLIAVMALSLVAQPVLFSSPVFAEGSSITAAGAVSGDAVHEVNGNKILRVLCPTVVSGSSLAVGIIAGNKVSNKINEKVHGVKQDRGIRLTDFAPHLDDVCLAITLMADKSPVGDIISKFVPVALTIAGIETGTATKDKR